MVIVECGNGLCYWIVIKRNSDNRTLFSHEYILGSALFNSNMFYNYLIFNKNYSNYNATVNLDELFEIPATDKNGVEIPEYIKELIKKPATESGMYVSVLDSNNGEWIQIENDSGADDTNLISLNGGEQIKFYTSRLATLLENNLTAEQKAETIVMEQSVPVDAVIFGTCTHTDDGGSTNSNAILSLQFNPGSENYVDLSLAITYEEWGIDHVIYPLANSEGDEAWFNQMTVSRLISILQSITPQDATYSSDLLEGYSAEVDPRFNCITVQTINNRHLINSSGVILLEGVSE